MDEAINEHINGVLDHKKLVGSYMNHIATELFKRAVEHDYSKLSSVEFDAFVEATPELKHLTYGSEEYKQALAKIKPALAHHYLVNRHHPEYFSAGINSMSLIDIIEMLCDWMAAIERVKDGDIHKSLEINKERFGIGEQLQQVIKNTVGDIELYYGREHLKDGLQITAGDTEVDG